MDTANAHPLLDHSATTTTTTIDPKLVSPLQSTWSSSSISPSVTRPTSPLLQRVSMVDLEPASSFPFEFGSDAKAAAAVVRPAPQTSAVAAAATDAPSAQRARLSGTADEAATALADMLSVAARQSQAKADAAAERPERDHDAHEAMTEGATGATPAPSGLSLAT